jgi:hypothetical protein
MVQCLPLKVLHKLALKPGLIEPTPSSLRGWGPVLASIASFYTSFFLMRKLPVSATLEDSESK